MLVMLLARFCADLSQPPATGNRAHHTPNTRDATPTSTMAQAFILSAAWPHSSQTMLIQAFAIPDWVVLKGKAQRFLPSTP